MDIGLSQLICQHLVSKILVKVNVNNKCYLQVIIMTFNLNLISH